MRDRNQPAGDPATGRLAPVQRERSRTRASDRVYDALVSAIRELRLAPGASLSESELAEQLQVSRTPVREAIARLADSGLVSVVPQVGTRVDRISLREVELARFVRESLELAAVEAACRESKRDVARLRELIAEQERCHADDDFDGFFVADELMHHEIFAMSGYPAAWDAMQGMKVQLDRLRRLNREPATVRALIEEHRAVVDALEAGDVPTCRDVVSRHARRVLAYVPALRAEFPDYLTE